MSELIRIFIIGLSLGIGILGTSFLSFYLFKKFIIQNNAEQEKRNENR